MQKKILISVIIFSFVSISFAVIQTAWEETYGGENSDACNAICIAPDNGILMVGYTNSFGAGNSDIQIIKTDEDGNEEWSQIYGGTGWENALAVCVSSNEDGYVLTGYTTENGNFDVFCMKIDLSGNQEWYTTIGGDDFDIAESICRTTDGEYMICGYTNSYGLGEDDIYVIKINDNGIVSWEETYGCAKSDTAHSIKQTSDGNYILCGSTGLYDIPVPNSNGRNREVYIIKLDDAGNTLLENSYWIRGTHQNDYDVGFDICETSDGGFCVVGHTSQHLQELMDVALLKVDAELNEVWKTSLELEVYYDFGYSILEDVNSTNLIICGSFKYQFVRCSDMFLMILDAEGNELERQTYGNNDSESGNCIVQREDGPFLVGGYYSPDGIGNNDAWLLEMVNLSADFETDVETGHAPLEVQFADLSSGMIDGWAWDFDNDGSIDSSEQNPTWNYSEPGYYDVQLTVSYGGVEDVQLIEDCIRVFDGYSALEFDGEESNITCAASDVPEIENAFTLEAWIYPEDYGPDTNFGLGRIFDKTVISVFLNNTFPLYEDQSLVVQMEHEDGTISTATTPPTSICLDQWQHIAVSYDGVDNLALYIGGLPLLFSQPVAPSGAVADNSNHDLVMGNTGDLTKSFVGKIDEIRVWDVFLEYQQIQENMNQYLSSNEPGLICYWKLDEGAGDTASDEISLMDFPLHDTRWSQGYPLEPSLSQDLLVPEEGKLSAYPNPFNPSTTISFSLPSEYVESVQLCIYNLKGQKVKTFLINSPTEQPINSVTWNGTDENNKAVASGIYFYNLRTENFNITNKMLLLR